MLQGYAFCEYHYPEVTDVVIATLNLQTVGSKTLTVKRAVAGQSGLQPLALPQAQVPSAVTNAFAMQHRQFQHATQALIGPSITLA